MAKSNENKRKRWSYYIIELLVVFVGVTAGFLMNSWREDSQEQKLEYKYLQSFYNDLQTDKENLDSLFINSQEKTTKLTEILKETEVVGKPLTEELANEVINTIMYIEWLTPSNDTYEDIINSGNLNIISDYDLKESISSYYKFLKEVKAVEQYYADHMNSQVFPYLYKNYHLYKQVFVHPEGYKDFEFTNNYLASIAFLQQCNNVYNTALERNGLLLALLEQAIDKAD